MMAGSKNSKVLADAARDPTVRTAASAAVAAGGAAEGVRRIARGQIDLAVELLESADGGELDEAIHESRKAFKRLRALVRLARDPLGDEAYRRENETFRDAPRAPRPRRPAPRRCTSCASERKTCGTQPRC